MTIRENVLAILNYEKYDRFPVVTFGFWKETLWKWVAEGYLKESDLFDYDQLERDSESEKIVNKKLGIDYDWGNGFRYENLLFPSFEKKLLEKKEDGSCIYRDELGLIVMEKPGVTSPPCTIDFTLKDRETWESLYLPRLQWDEQRIDRNALNEFSQKMEKEGLPFCMHVGSFIGNIRNILGVEQLSYLYADDEDLYAEIIEVCGNLVYRCAEEVLKMGVKFDYAYIWEDMCYNKGPLISPHVFEEYCGPLYRRFTQMLKSYGVDIVSVDCDGKIDTLLPTWIENGVNTMFPMEIGTWNASLKPWREQYGKQLRGVGGMNKYLFAQDYAAIDREIERLKPLIEMGGYIPCPDHSIMPDAKFSNVQYYCEKIHDLRV